MSLQIGQRVKCIAEVDDNELIVDEIGTIREIDPDGGWYGVEFDNFVGGHKLGEFNAYSCTFGYGWYCYETTLVAIDISIGLEELI